jgi:hypothetical protein
MGKTILYKLFKIVSIPKKLRPMLEAEGFVVFDEGISGSLFMKDFKSPVRRAKYRKELFSGSYSKKGYCLGILEESHKHTFGS